MKDGHYVSPCGKCTTMHHWVTGGGTQHRWQHGENPEHSLLLSDEEWRASPRQLVWEWIDAIHERVDGLWKRAKVHR